MNDALLNDELHPTKKGGKEEKKSSWKFQSRLAFGLDPSS